MTRAPWIFIRSTDPSGTVVYTSKHLSPEAAITSIHNMLEKAQRTGVNLVFDVELNLRKVDASRVIYGVIANRSGNPEPNPLTDLEALISREYYAK